jgi:ATP-dependent DNA helicase DinG
MPRTIPDILARSGPLAAVLGEGFEPRPEQVAMARAVAETMEHKGRLLAEAGTGVGKSFAYLVPAILRATLNKERVVIATNTIALQEQLVQKDIPLLKGTIDKWDLGPGAAELVPVLVKGRGNYVSIRRLKLASQRQDSLFPDAAALRSLHVLEDWAYSTTDGSRSSLPAEALESAEVWDHARSDADNCMGRKCEFYKTCFFQNARREMERANLLVCNHALFFSDLALRTRLGEAAALLPAYHHVVLDEAHNVEEVACEHFGVALTEPRVLRLLRTLYHPRRRKGYLTERTLAIADAEAVERAVHLVLHAENAARAFFESLLFRFQRPSPGAPTTGAASGTLRIREPDLVENHLTPVMRDLALRLKTIKDEIKSEQDKFELNSYAKRAGDIADAADALLTQSVPDAVYWLEVEGGGMGGWGQAGARPRGPRVTLACSPIEAAPILREALFERQISVTLTSATLATRSARDDEHPEHAEAAFAYVMNQLGCGDAKTLQLGSPFDYASQAELIVDTTLPEPRGQKGATAEYLRELAARVMKQVRETDGGAFVLFTSFAHLNAIADEISGPLSREGLPVLAQGRDGSRSQILEKFRQDEHAVLLGAASFWQGVDVRGRALRNVIITRLPFDPPDRPLTQARLERIQERGGNPFMEESLPRAVIRFKQGFGRLIRSRADNGRVVVLDPRILTARYGRRFLDALPPGIPVNVIEDHPADD